MKTIRVELDLTPKMIDQLRFLIDGLADLHGTRRCYWRCCPNCRSKTSSTNPLL